MKTNMLKSLSVIIAFASSLHAFADQFSFGGLNYQTTDNSNNVTVVAGTYTSPQYKIPDTFTYQGITYTVTGVGNKAFYGCNNLIGIELPNTVQSIGEWAFYNSGLRSVLMPSVVSIEEYAFGLCSNLSNINLPSTLTNIGRSAFSSSGLRSITIPASVSSVGKSAFSNCDKLTTIQVESGNTTYYSPNNCNAIITISDKILIAGCSGTQNIPNDVVAIGENAFYGSGLRSVTLPQSVTSIGDWAFYSNSELQSVEMSSNVASIGEYAFGLCSKLTAIELPGTLLSIGRSAFSSSGLTSIMIPKTVMLVGKNAFSNCDKLTTMQVEAGNSFYESPNGCNAIIQGNVLVSGCTGTKDIPENVTVIGENAFYGSGIKNVILPSNVTTIEEWAFYSCGELESINLSENLQYIDECAFSLCSKLSRITLPSTLKSIGKRAFSSCSKLYSIYSMIQTPFTIDDNVFDELYDIATLYVPTGTIDKYKTTAAWSNFGNNIKEFDPSGISSPTIALQHIYSDNGMLFIESTEANNCNIYSMSGQLMRKLALKKGTNTVSGLSKGVYIINGNKVLVK